MNKEIIDRVGMKGEPSKYQMDIFESVHNSMKLCMKNEAPKSIIVQAVAGAGKTTVIVGCANLIPDDMSGLFLAFNKSIADELKGRLPSYVESKTMNSLGFSILRQYFQSKGLHNVSIDPNRTYKIINRVVDYKLRNQYSREICFLVNMCKANGYTNKSCNAPFSIGCVDHSVLDSMCIKFSKTVKPKDKTAVFNAVCDVLAASFDIKVIIKEGVIDFDDQKWLTVCHALDKKLQAPPKFDAIFVDELQDLNPVDQRLVKMVSTKQSFVMGVGDRRQSIYAFRGADMNSMDNFKSTFDCEEMPLSITYRCSKELVKHAKKIVPEIEPFSEAKDGEVNEEQIEIPFDKLQSGDLIMCRNNAPLLPLAYEMIRNSVPFVLKGKDIVSDIVEIINSTSARKIWVDNPRVKGKKMPKMSLEGVDKETLAKNISKWYDDSINALEDLNFDTEAMRQEINDKYNVLLTFVDMTIEDSAQAVVDEINDLFSNQDDSNAVVLSTIHKAKGLEADRAFLYSKETMYANGVKADMPKEKFWMYDQERNLDYIARTRGKLHYGYFKTISS